MFWLKGCAKCRGDLFLEGDDWQCLQCGTYRYGAMPWSQYLRKEPLSDQDAKAATKRRKFGKNTSQNESASGATRV